MHSRVSRIKTAPENIDALFNAFTSSALPALREIAGYAGHSFGVNKETGDGQAVTFWESEAALKASEDAASGIRTDTVQAGGGSVVSIDRFEIALMERFTAPSTPAFVRVVRGEVDKTRLDDLAQAVRDESVDVVQSQNGARALVLAFDRASGRFAVTSVWESAEARDASMEAIAPMRDRVFDSVGARSSEIATYEVLSVEFVGAGAARG